MAGALKVRDTDGTLRTITAVKVRDVDGTLRTLAFIRVHDTDGTMREVFTADSGGGGGGGGGSSAGPTSITPASLYYSGKPYARSATFTASSSAGSPTSYAWGLLNGNGSVVAGASSATATLQVTAEAGEFNSSTFFCDVTVGGTVYRATCQFDYQNTGGSGVGGGGVQQ